MRSRIVPIFSTLAIVLVVTDVARSQTKDSPRLAEVKFVDGSVVRMSIMQESLEVVTKYGKLTIPTNDIRKIEMGRHPPEGVEKTVDQAIQLLASESFKQREDASRDLQHIGHWALPSLEKVAHSPDLETAKRVKALILKISEKTTPENLKMRSDDVIQTADFPVTGRIVSQTIKAYSPLFGEQALKLSDVRSMHLRGVRGEIEITIDAMKHGDTWYDSGVTLDPQLRLLVTSDGRVDLWPPTPGQYLAAPRGYDAPGKGGSYQAGALIGRVGETGRSFLVGDRYDGQVTEEGKLYLQIVGSPWNNASLGSYRVRVQTENAPNR